MERKWVMEDEQGIGSRMSPMEKHSTKFGRCPLGTVLHNRLEIVAGPAEVVIWVEIGWDGVVGRIGWLHPAKRESDFEGLDDAESSDRSE